MGDRLPPDWNERVNAETGEKSDRAQIIAATLLKESDRGCAIFGAAILHDDLESLFRSLCRRDDKSVKRVVDPLFQGYAPLATFSGRIQLAYAMRLIPKDLYQKLELVRRLRNDFAHESGPLSFQDPRCQDRLRLLIADGEARKISGGEDVELVVGQQVLTKRQIEERTAFVIAVSVLSARACFITEQIVEGHDVNAVVAALEKWGK